MAVRRRPDGSPTKWPATVAGLATAHPDEEIPLKKAVKARKRDHVLKEYLKGFLAFPVAITGVYLMWWSSKSDGFSYWFGTISGLVIMAVGMAYAVEFGKQLINGELTKGVGAAIKEIAMKEWMKVFIAFVSIISGVCLVATARRNLMLDEWMCYCIGIVLMAGGVNYFWIQSRFHKG